MNDIADSVLATELAARARRGSVIFIARSEAQAGRLAAASRVLAPRAGLVSLPAWDCLPYDRVAPSRGVMGRRMAALRRLSEPGPHLLVASVAALAQRLPPPRSAAVLTLAAGDALDPAALAAELHRVGYEAEATASAPGEIALGSEVIDLFPAAGDWPVRIRLSGQGTVAGIDRFDPATQRSRDSLDRLEIGPASELVLPPDQQRRPGLEHRLAEFYPDLRSAFDLLPDATLLLDAECDSRMESWLAQVEEARATRTALLRATGGALPPAGLYLDTAAWQTVRARGAVADEPDCAALPAFHAGRDPIGAWLAHVAEQSRAGLRVGVSGRRLARALRVADTQAEDWAALLARPAGTIAALPAGLAAGFATGRAMAVADADVWPPHAQASDPGALFSPPMQPGDAVIHLDHGLARLDGIETLPAPASADALALGFAGDARKLMPCIELDRVWRYGSGTEACRWTAPTAPPGSGGGMRSRHRWMRPHRR